MEKRHFLHFWQWRNFTQDWSWLHIFSAFFFGKYWIEFELFTQIMHIMQLFSENIWSNNFAKNEENQFAVEDFHESFVVHCSQGRERWNALTLVWIV